MPYQFRQTGAEIQDILDQVGENTTDIAQNAQDISTLNSNLTNTQSDLDAEKGKVSVLQQNVGQFKFRRTGWGTSFQFPCTGAGLLLLNHGTLIAFWLPAGSLAYQALVGSIPPGMTMTLRDGVVTCNTPTNYSWWVITA